MFEKFSDIIDAENLNEQQILDLYSDIIEMGDGGIAATSYAYAQIQYYLKTYYLYTFIGYNCVSSGAYFYAKGVRFNWTDYCSPNSVFSTTSNITYYYTFGENAVAQHYYVYASGRLCSVYWDASVSSYHRGSARLCTK